jgi:LysM repeat protein
MNTKTKTIRTSLLVAAIATWGVILHASTPKTFSDQKGKTHRVEPGETAYSISKAYNISLKDLYAMNPGTENGVKSGTELVLVQSAQATGETKYAYHTIEKKETLYAVSRKYSVSMQDIMDANSGLTADTFQEGRVIRIPIGMKQQAEKVITYQLHKVQKKETAYSIAKQYNITMDALYEANPSLKTSGLKNGSMLRIPQLADKKLTENDVRIQEENGGKMLQERTKVKTVNMVKVGILFPFFDQNDGQSSRFVEYLEGFLLAVEEFKQKGYSAEVYVFNIESGTDTKRLASLLESDEFKNLNVLVGGVSQDQISVLSDFAKKHKVKYVIPFTSKNDDVLSNEFLFQVNTPHNYLYPGIAQAFSGKFKGSNVIFLNDPEGDQRNDKSDFRDALKAQLDRSKISNTSTLISDNLPLELSALMSSTKQNVIIPTSSSATCLGKVISVMQTVQKENPNLAFSLFGYPEWQTYSSQLQDNMRKLDTYFYSSFYADNNLDNTKLFVQKYKARFGKTMMNIFPKYGLLGYDTGNYFLNIVKLYGANFDLHIEKYRSLSIQSALSFERVNSWGGFINTGFYLVHYTPSTIEKIDYRK